MRFNKLRTIAKKNPLLYRISFHLYLKSRFGGEGRIPQKGDHFYFDGYAKSGNSSIVEFLKSLGKEKYVFSSHLHAIAPLKIALKKNIPAIIVYRDPYNSIASWYFHFNQPGQKIDEELLHWMVREWVVFYTFVLRNQDKLFITSLEGVRGVKSGYIDCLNNYMGDKSFIWDLSQFEKYIQVKKPVKTGNDMKVVGSSAGPWLERENAKKPIIEYLHGLKDSSLMHSLYLELGQLENICIGGSYIEKA